MKSKKRNLLMALFVALLGGAAWLLLPSRDPLFHVRPESEWIKSIEYIPALEKTARRTDHAGGPAKWALKQLDSQAAANRGAPN